jgi:hypothetical protein
LFIYKKMVRHALKHIFQKPTPDIDSSDRTQQLRSKTVYAATVDLAQHLVKGNNSLYKTYTGPYEIVTQAGNSKLIASRSYNDLLSITKGKVLLNQLPLNSHTQAYYQKNFARGQMYEGNYNQFDPSFNFVGHTGCNNSVMVYDISNNGFTGPSSYDTLGGYIGATGPGLIGISASNKHIFVDPNHCYYSDPCLLDASYTRFVSPVLSGLTGSGPFTAQQIISADQYRGFSYPMSNFSLTCAQQILNQETGPLFCPPLHPTLSNFTVPQKVLGDPPFLLVEPTSNSQGGFSYTSSNPSVATVSDNTVTIVGPGSSIITATQAPYGNYSSANISTQLYVFSFTTTNEVSATPGTYLFGTAFRGANMTPYFDSQQESGFVSANITNDSSGAISPFLSVSSGQTYTTLALYDLSEGQIVTFTLTVTYTSKPTVVLTLAFEYVIR